MSLILEALKKSEAERRLGRVPDLLAPAPSRLPLPRRWRSAFVIAPAAALLLAGLAWWWFARPSAPDVPMATPATDAARAPEAASVAATPRSEPVVGATRRVAPPTARAAAEVIANVPVPQDPDFAGTERESVAVPATAIPLVRSVPQEDATAPTTPRPTLPPLPSQPPTATNIPSAQDATASAPTSTAARPELESLPSLAIVPASEREGWPPLRLSMHVYDPDPAARIVLIDGKRYREGDTIAPDLVVDVIRPDGVALAYRGQRFLLARR